MFEVQGFGNDDQTTKQSSLGFDIVEFTVDVCIGAVVDMVVNFVVGEAVDTVVDAVVIETRICFDN